MALADASRAHHRLIFGGSEANYIPETEVRQVGLAAFKKLIVVIEGVLPRDANEHQANYGTKNLVRYARRGELKQRAVAEMVDMSHWEEGGLEMVRLLAEGIAVPLASSDRL